MRSSEIAEMIIHSVSTATLTFIFVADTLHVAIVVISPYDRDVIRNNKARIIYVKSLLIRNEDLSDLLCRHSFVFLKNLTLYLEYLLERARPYRRIFRTLHSLIMKAAHTHCIDIVILSGLADTVVQLLDYRLAICNIIPFAVARRIPFRWGCIIEKKRLTVARSDHDAPFICCDLAVRMAVECACTCMHGWCKHICLEAEHKLAHLVISLRTYVSEIFLEVSFRPCLESPVLVIDEDSTIFHRRLTQRWALRQQKSAICLSAAVIMPAL